MEFDGGQNQHTPCCYKHLLEKKPSNVSNTSSAQDSKLCGEEPKSLAPWPRALESKGSTTAVSQFTDHCWIWGCLKFGIHFVPWTSSCSSFSALKLPFGGISNCRIDHFETNPDCFFQWNVQVPDLWEIFHGHDGPAVRCATPGHDRVTHNPCQH